MIKKNKSRRKAKYVLNHLRNADREEMQTIYGDKWFQRVLKTTMKTDFVVGVSKTSGKPTAIFGCSPDKNEPNCAVIWLLSTSEIDDKRFALIKKAKKELACLEQKFDFLFNFIHKRNYKMLRLLKYLGFKTLKYNLDSNSELTFFYKNIYLSGMKI